MHWVLETLGHYENGYGRRQRRRGRRRDLQLVLSRRNGQSHNDSSNPSGSSESDYQHNSTPIHIPTRNGWEIPFCRPEVRHFFPHWIEETNLIDERQLILGNILF